MPSSVICLSARRTVRRFWSRLDSTELPADSIREGIQIVADHLTKNTGIHSINVYFTGHSLGCATASLAYARAVAKQSTDYKSNVRIRDAYMFAAPVIGDVKTRDAFNAMMSSGLPRSMWRVSNVSWPVLGGRG
jgi:hypothetical protein